MFKVILICKNLDKRLYPQTLKYNNGSIILFKTFIEAAREGVSAIEQAKNNIGNAVDFFVCDESQTF